MSKMACTCGNIMSDVEYPCETEGWLISEAGKEKASSVIDTDTQAYMESVSNGESESWLHSYFNEYYPLDLPVASVLMDIIESVQAYYAKSVAECGACGRLHIQESHDVNRYLAFSPENNTYNRVFAVDHGNDV